jgi:hypothetical protein
VAAPALPIGQVATAFMIACSSLGDGGLLGDGAPLSAASIARLKAGWQ